MNEIDLLAARERVVIVVLRVDVGPDPREAQIDLPWRERVVIDPPDGKVGITSTRSSTAAVGDPEIDGGEEHDDKSQAA